ncbi:MAG: tetratricopeptide repeat protein [Polyangiaceae bacterium]|nr:tetratricopeptide repeat protein [Polyangiaceae bacterium]
MEAKTPRSRAIWARRGLASRSRLDRTTHAMLLRQLYLSHFERRNFREALDLTASSLTLGVLSDVVHQDAARAAAAMGDIDVASRHLRTAARVGPASRRAFHWWTLGSLYFLANRHAEAVGALERAARWGTRDKPLYQGHLALALIAAGEDEDVDTSELIERLESVPAGQGYGRFVLGMLALHERRLLEARSHLQAFVERTERGRLATSIALDGELTRAKKALQSLARGRAG